MPLSKERKAVWWQRGASQSRSATPQQWRGPCACRGRSSGRGSAQTTTSSCHHPQLRHLSQVQHICNHTMSIFYKQSPLILMAHTHNLIGQCMTFKCRRFHWALLLCRAFIMGSPHITSS